MQEPGEHVQSGSPVEVVRGIASPLFPPDRPIPYRINPKTGVKDISQSFQVVGLGTFRAEFSTIDTGEDSIHFLLDGNVIAVTEQGPVRITLESTKITGEKIAKRGLFEFQFVRTLSELFTNGRAPTIHLKFPRLNVVLPSETIEEDSEYKILSYFEFRDDEDNELIDTLLVEDKEQTWRNIQVVVE